MYRAEEFLPSATLPPRRAPERPIHLDWLPARERELATIVHERGAATAVEICETLDVPISNSAVRSMLGRLEGKGVLTRRKQGRRFLYVPAQPSEATALAALSEIVARHFDGSAMDAALALLGMIPARDAAQLEAISRLSTLLRQVELD